MLQLETLEQALAPYQKQLNNHPLYSTLNNINDVKLFMQNHVFAVWDFMSLLKALQTALTCTKVPWVPQKDTATARFINEIVVGEETDLDLNGVPKSHFEMYLDAMGELGANTAPIHTFIAELNTSGSIKQSLNKTTTAESTADFINFTFDVIATNETHKIASAFTFGREDVIPEMFLQILKEIDPQNAQLKKLRFYLERHIELDGDEHGPLSLKMIENLCGDNNQKWEEVTQVAIACIEKRIKFWTGIQQQIN